MRRKSSLNLRKQFNSSKCDGSVTLPVMWMGLNRQGKKTTMRVRNKLLRVCATLKKN